MNMSISLRERIRINLISAMSAANINQVQLAERLGIKKGTVNNWVRGNNSPDVDMVPAICAVLGISIETLYAPTESEQINSQIKHKKSSPLTDQEVKVMKKYRALDPYGKDTVDAVLENELKRCQEQARPQKPKMHLMRMVASDGTYKERWMTDEEVQALKEQINTLEEPTGI